LSFLRLPANIASEVKRLFLWLVSGLIFGFVSGCIGVGVDYQTSVPNPVDHWYDLLGVFAAPGIGMTWGFFNPPDGYYGDVWDNRGHVIVFNAFSWMLLFLLVFSVRSIGKALLQDLKNYRDSHAR
jgi:hypothetical protein